MINIYNIDGSVLMQVPVTKEAKREEELSKSDYISLSFNAAIKVVLPVGSYIEYTYYVDTVRKITRQFLLLEPYEPTQLDEMSWKYTPEFHHPKMILGKVPFYINTKNSQNEDIRQTNWSFVGSPDNIMGKVCDFLNKDIKFGSCLWKAVVTNELKNSLNVSFADNDVLSALSSIANAVGDNCEWHIDYDNEIIYLGKIIIGKTPTELNVGKNVGITSLSESKENYYNSFTVFGGTRNITQVNNKGENISSGDIRLQLSIDNGSIIVDGKEIEYTIDRFSTMDLRQNKVVEPLFTKVLNFSDVYPSLDTYVYNVRGRKKYVLDSTTNQKIPLTYNADGSVATYKTFTVWYMRLAYYTTSKIEGKKVINTTIDEGVTHYWYDFEITDNLLINGKKISCSFEPNFEKKALSVPLAGRGTNGKYVGFELNYHKKSISIRDTDDVDAGNFEVLAGDYEIIYQETNGLIVPTNAEDMLIPRGEELPTLKCNITVLYNIAMPDIYKIGAQQKLLKKATDEIKRLLSDLNNYTCKSYPQVFQKNNPRLQIGQYVTYKDGQGYNLETRVLKLSTNIDYDFIQEITVGNQAIKGTITQLKEDVQSIIANGGNANTQGNYTVSQLNNIIAQYGGKYFLSKVNEDIAQKVITFMEGLKIGGDGKYGIDAKGNAVLGNVQMLDAVLRRIVSLGYNGATQQGFGIVDRGDGKFRLDINDLQVWGKAVFQELEVRKLSYAGGNVYLSGSGSRIFKTEELYNEAGKLRGWRCWLLADDGTTATQNMWRVGDQARCQTFGLANKQKPTRSWWRLVTAVSEENVALTDELGNELYDGKKFAWIEIAKDNCELGSDVPMAGDTIVLDGNQNPNERERQGVMILETTGANTPRIVAYKGVVGYTHEGCEVFYLSPQGSRIVSTSFEWVSPTGDIIHIVNYRGEWQSGVSYGYYDQVSHGNGVWLCTNINGSTTEPKEGNADWQLVMKAEKGEKGDDGKDYWQQDVWVDLSAATYDQNIWYTVVGERLPNNGFAGIKVVVNLNSGTKPSWSTHKLGFSVDFHIDTQASGWGITHAETIIYSDTFNFCSVSPVSYKQLGYGSIPILYLRGGGRYRVISTYNAAWKIYKDGYTWQSGKYSQSAMPSNTRPTPEGHTLKGEQGFGIVAALNRDYRLSEATWNVYAEIGHSESWSANASERNGCRIGDIFTVSGAAADTDNYHIAYYRSTTNSGDLTGVCTAHSVSPKGEKGDKGDQGDRGPQGATGTPGKDAVSASFSPAALTFSAKTEGNGNATADTTSGNIATITMLEGSSKVTGTYSITSTVGCTATISGSTVTVKSVAHDTIDGRAISRTSANVTVKCVYNGKTCYVDLPISVSVSAVWGGLVTSQKGLESKYNEVSDKYNALPLKTTNELTQYTSSIKQSAREISLKVGETVVGRHNLLTGSAFEKKTDYWTGNDAYTPYISVLNNYNGYNSAVIEGKSGTNRGVDFIRVRVNVARKYVVSAMLKCSGAVSEGDFNAYIVQRDGSMADLNKNLFIPLSAAKNMIANEWMLAAETLTLDANTVFIDCVFLYYGTKTAYIACPQIAEGEEYAGYTLSEQDRNYIGGNLLDNTGTLVTGGKLKVASENTVLHPKDNSADEIEKHSYKGFPTLNTDARFYTSDINTVEWDFVFATFFKQGQDYMLSFMAKGNKGGRFTASMYNYYNTEELFAEAPNRVDTDNSHVQMEFKEDYIWTRYWVRWRVVGEQPPRYVRITCHQGCDLYLSQPKMEYGATATEWRAEKTDYIEDKSIAGSLLDAGIDINSKEIMLTADKTTFRTTKGTKVAMFDEDGLNAQLVRAQRLQTKGKNGAEVRIEDGMVQIFGAAGVANIRFGLDDNGYATLGYYDNHGNLLYDLGPKGIVKLDVADSTMTRTAFINLDAAGLVSPYTEKKDGYLWITADNNNKFFGLQGKPNVYVRVNLGVTKSVELYQYRAPRLNGDVILDEKYRLSKSQAEKADGCYFTSNQVQVTDGNFTNLAKGTYLPWDAQTRDNTKLRPIGVKSVPKLSVGGFMTLGTSALASTSQLKVLSTVYGGGVYVFPDNGFGNVEID